tara:strand:- start:330 stop:449 length:120 start_codon:yes stop_codon:yes gene_type:complete
MIAKPEKNLAYNNHQQIELSKKHRPVHVGRLRTALQVLI